MTEEIRIWQIENDEILEEFHRAKLNLEERLENWLENDIAILADDLLVIGRQVETGFGGIIDLLCLDISGDLVVVELKRDKTPRDVTAQVLDYGAWVQNLSNDEIRRIADKYLGDGGPLDRAYSHRFSGEIPDVLNENHALLIVASEVDPATERIIRYLSDSYGVNINVATFQYFQDKNGKEFLARVFLLEPSQVEYKTQSRGRSKRQPNLTLDELQEIANENGVGKMYAKLTDGLCSYFDKHTTRSSLSFYANFDNSRKVVFSLLPPISNAESGLKFQIYFWRMAELFGASEDDIHKLLPENIEPWQYYNGADEDMSGYQGFFCSMDEVKHFLNEIGNLSKSR